MKRIAIAAFALTALSFGSMAKAEEGLNNTAHDWSGFYVGAHGGYGFGEHDGQPIYDAGLGPVQGVFAAGKIDADGYLAGVTLGAQHQTGSVVLGVEIDGSWGDFGGKETFDALGASKGYHWTIETELDGLYTARARIGYAMGNLLVYGTGGVAFAQVGMNETVTADKIQGFTKDGTVTALASSEENMLGWIAGGGAEYAFAPGWSFKAEALYINFGEVNNRFSGTAYPDKAPCIATISANCSFPHTTDAFDGDMSIKVVRLGLNYRF
jgi:outer membrane immunogenic protein